jgi:hypothetical protein
VGSGNKMTSNSRKNDDEWSSFLKNNIKSSGQVLVKKDTKGNHVVNKGGKQIYQSEGKILRLDGYNTQGYELPI